MISRLRNVILKNIPFRNKHFSIIKIKSYHVNDQSYHSLFHFFPHWHLLFKVKRRCSSFINNKIKNQVFKMKPTYLNETVSLAFGILCSATCCNVNKCYNNHFRKTFIKFYSNK